MTSDFSHALALQGKLVDPAVTMQWMDATFPVLGKFLALHEGWEGEIIVFNEAGEVLHEIKPRAQAVAANVMHLVQSPDYHFRLKSSPTFQPGRGLPSLFLSLADQLDTDTNTDIPRSCIEMICNFDHFTRSETDCPGLGKIVAKILGEEVNGGEIPTGAIPGAEAMREDIMGAEAMEEDIMGVGAIRK
jgi:hypothetical protein